MADDTNFDFWDFGTQLPDIDDWSQGWENIYTSLPDTDTQDFNYPYTPSPGYGWSDLIKDAGKILTGASGAGKLGQLAGFAGIASLLNKFSGSQAQVPTGYQGGIPQYTAARQQYAFAPSAQVGTATDDQISRYIRQQGLTDPMVAQNMINYGVTPERMSGIAGIPAAQVEQRYRAAFGPNISEGTRRPGSGGITYFSPMQYATGAAPAPAPAPAPGAAPAPAPAPGDSSAPKFVPAPAVQVASAPAPASQQAAVASAAPSDMSEGARASRRLLENAPSLAEEMRNWSVGKRRSHVERLLRQNPNVSQEVRNLYTSFINLSNSPERAASIAEQRQRDAAAEEAANAAAAAAAAAGPSPEQYIASLNARLPANNPGYAQRHRYSATAQERPAIEDQFTNIQGGYYGFNPVYSTTSSFGDGLLSSVPGMKNPALVLGALDTSKWDPKNKYVMALPGYREGADPRGAPAQAPGGYQFQYDPEMKNWFASGFIDPSNQKGYLIDRFGNALQRPVDFLTSAYTDTPTYQFATPESRNYFPSTIYSTSTSEPPESDFNIQAKRRGGMAAGGVATLPAAKGRFVQGPGDGVNDRVPATIEGNQPARLADGEFVLPARIVSELGNGSSAAGARKLYAFMDRVERMMRRAKRGKPSGADKLLNKLA